MSKRKTLHVIANAHLDPVWVWLWRDGCSEALTTMQSALDRMRETPDLCFARSSAATYRWAQEMDPRLFEDIRRRIGEGRWEVVNGWIEQPDCNIPSTESLVRHCLYGKSYFSRELGVDVQVGYNVDSFGHSAGLPQILARAGYKYYVFMRPKTHENPNLPVFFWWQSPDGSRVLCWRIPTSYGQSVTQTAEKFEELVRNSATMCFAPGFDDGAIFVGVGNHGGGPTRRQIAQILELQKDESLPEFRFSTLERFFQTLERSPAFKDIPVFCTEMQHHAPGCYSAMGEIKALNRRAEQALCHAETMAVMAGLDRQYEYAGDELRESWWKLLFNQFHDIMAGSSIKPAYTDALQAIGSACQVGKTTIIGAAHTLARRVDTSDVSEGVLFLANPLPWRRSALVQYDTFISSGEDPITHLAAKGGERIPVQWLAADAPFGPGAKPWRKLTATVDLPPCGYRAFRLASGEVPGASEPWEGYIETGKEQPGIVSLKAEDGTELLSSPVRFVVIEDLSDTWAHGVNEFRREIGRPALTSSKMIEDGPVCRVIRQKCQWWSSEIVLDIITYRYVDAVELRLKINWQEHRQMLKLEVPTDLKGVRTFAKVPGGTIERPPIGCEEPCQDWIALEGRVGDKTYSIALLNDSTYGYDCLDGLLRATVIRSAPFAEHDPIKLPPETDNPFLDQGWQERRFWLVRGEGSHLNLNLQRRAEEVQTPAEYVVDSAHPGTEPWENSFLSISPESLIATAIKRAEDGDGIIIRIQETRGEKATARVRIPALPLDWCGAIGAWEIKTLRIRTKDGKPAAVETDLLER